MGLLTSAIERVGFSGPVTALATESIPADRLRRRFVGRDQAEALAMAQSLVARGAGVSLHVRDKPVGVDNPVEQQVHQYLQLIEALAEALLPDAEISLKLEQLGLHEQGLPVAVANLTRIASVAAERGIVSTLDMESEDEVDATLAAWHQAHAEVPALGIAIQSYLPRSESDCRELAGLGARVRLCKGGYARVPGVTYENRRDIDMSYVRCARELLHGGAYGMFATHDDRLLRIVDHLAQAAGRDSSDWEYQFLQGVRPRLMSDLLADGNHVRCYIAFGEDWYSWFIGRLAARPANVLLLGRAVLSGATPE